jgi:hypothetical protein
VSEKAIEKIKAYANNAYHESMTHYHDNNQYADLKKVEDYLRLIRDKTCFY